MPPGTYRVAKLHIEPKAYRKSTRDLYRGVVPEGAQRYSDLILNREPRKLDGGRGRDDVLGGNRDQLDFGRFINSFHCRSPFDLRLRIITRLAPYNTNLRGLSPFCRDFDSFV